MRYVRKIGLYCENLKQQGMHMKHVRKQRLYCGNVKLQGLYNETY